MVGDVEDYKVLVSGESKSEEVQDLFFELGCEWGTCGNSYNKMVSVGHYIFSTDSNMLNYGLGIGRKEITLQQLKDLVVLKRNDIIDANYESESGNRKYYLTDTEFFEFILGVWVNIDELVDEMSFKFINKEVEVEMKEYIAKVSGDWRLVDRHELVSGRIEVPEGAEIFLLDESCGEDTLYFVKHDGDVFHEYYISGTNISHNTWIKGTIKELHKGMGEVLWERDHTETPNTSIQEKLKFIEKWLNGENIQYILGVESEKTQWHNFTEGAMQYIKRSDIKFREAPKYVTINGIEFKSAKKLLKYVKSNFDLECEE